MEQGMLEDAKFLIVDDELANVRILERMLEGWGCLHVRSTTNPHEAVPLFGEFQPDLVLLDLMMPELDGFQIMQQLRPLIAEGDYLPILVLTADTTLPTKRKALAAGAKDFLAKPFDIVELSLRISNLVETRFFYLELQKDKRLLQENYQRLQELETLRDDLTHMLVHDLRTPLTAFLSGIQTMELLGELNDEQREPLEIALEGGQTLLDMVGDLLDIGKMESESLHLEIKSLGAASLIEQALRHVTSLAGDKSLTLACEVAPDLPDFEADEDKLVRTLVNLLGNAIKFTPAGGTVTVSARFAENGLAEGRQTQNGQAIVFAVSDTGEGIPPEAFAAIFEKFGQVATRKAGRRRSTGLGLTFCKMVVEAHGGHIWVESKPDHGSTFLFAIPRRLNDPVVEDGAKSEV